MEKKRVELNVVITAVSSPAKIAEVARVQGFEDPQDVFVRVNFKVGDTEYDASNKLKFLTKNGYQKLLDAKESGEEVNITLVRTEGQKDAFIYVNPDIKVTVDDLFSKPLKKVDNRHSIEELF